MIRPKGTGASPLASPLASPATLCRLENRVDRKACVELSKLLVELFIESFDTPPEELVLDFDATDDPIHGQQERRFFHGYYDHHCYLPLYVFCGDELLVAYLRPSNIDASKHARAVLKLLVRKLRGAWPDVKITIRRDSGFCRWRLMRWCDRNGIGYVLGLARNPALERAARDWIERAARQFERASSKKPDSPVILAWLSRAYLSAGRRAEGLEAFSKARKLAPGERILRELTVQFPELAQSAD